MTQSKPSGDSVRAYLRDIGRIPLLKHDEEILLGRRVQRLMDIESQRTSFEDELGHKVDDKRLAELMQEEWKTLRRELRDGKKPRKNGNR